MPIDLHPERAHLRGKCRLEDAEALREWLQQNPGCELDLSACTHLHSGVLQIILAHGRLPIAWPSDASFARWLEHYIEGVHAS